MNFQINNNKGVFEIEGNFTKENTATIKRHFNKVLDTYYEVVVSLKKVNKMDESALKVLQFISKKAKKRSKTLFVLVKGNKCVEQIINKVNLNVNDY